MPLHREQAIIFGDGSELDDASLAALEDVGRFMKVSHPLLTLRPLRPLVISAAS